MGLLDLFNAGSEVVKELHGIVRDGNVVETADGFVEIEGRPSQRS